MGIENLVDRKGGIRPSLHIVAKTIPEAWEKALFAVWENGISVETDYDVKEVGEPPSKEAAVLITITNPLKEPRIHKRGIPEGLDSLQKYIMEVCDGIHDHWVNVTQQNGTTVWDYSYHQRLFNYPVFDAEGNLIRTINQVEDLMQKLEKERHLTKSAQAITWIPSKDHKAGHSPCLQRIHLRLIPAEERGREIIKYALNMDAIFRSRDDKNALHENISAFVELMKRFADELTRRIGIEVIVGAYSDFSDSLHVYGRDFNPNVMLPSKGVTKYEDFMNFLDKTRKMSWTEKTWRSDDPVVVNMMREEEIALLADPDYTRRGGIAARPKIIYDGEGNPIGAEHEKGKLLYKEGKMYLPDGKLYKPELIL